MSDGTVLTLVALTLAVVAAGLLRLVKALDTTELALRRLVADVWSARRAVESVGQLAAVVERDAGRGHAELDRLRALQQPRRPGSGDGGAGPVSLPFRPGRVRG